MLEKMIVLQGCIPGSVSWPLKYKEPEADWLTSTCPSGATRRGRGVFLTGILGGENHGENFQGSVAHTPKAIQPMPLLELHSP